MFPLTDLEEQLAHTQASQHLLILGTVEATFDGMLMHVL